MKKVSSSSLFFHILSSATVSLLLFVIVNIIIIDNKYINSFQIPVRRQRKILPYINKVVLPSSISNKGIIKNEIIKSRILPLSSATNLKSTVSNKDDFASSASTSTSTHPYEYDLAVIGAGPVGVQAAIVAASVFKKNVVLIDSPRASGKLMNEATNEDLSIGGPTGLFSKALRDAAKRIKVSTLRGMGLREDSGKLVMCHVMCVNELKCNDIWVNIRHTTSYNIYLD